MTVGKRFVLTNAAILSLTLAVGATALNGFYGLAEAITDLSSDCLPGLYSMGRIENSANDLRAALLMRIASAEPSASDPATESAERQFKAALVDYGRTISHDEDRRFFSRIEPAYDRVRVAWSRVSVSPKGTSGFAAFQTEVLPELDALKAAIHEEIEWNRKSGDETTASGMARIHSVRLLIWSISLASIVIGVVLTWAMIRGTNTILRKVATGLADGAGQTASVARQVSESSQSLAQSTNQQAASIQETSASSLEIGSMAASNAGNTHKVANLIAASQTKIVAAAGGLERMVVAMEEIRSSSEKISKINRTIDEIAFQTNILALNAAVEAARAGDAGMGFAVVADEVRNLAQRCTAAARDTAALIEEARSKANDGKSRVDQLSVSMREITAESAEVTALVHEVNSGSREQALGIERITNAVVQMEQLTQKGAADAQESAAAAEELQAQSQMMRSAVEKLTALVG